MTAITDSDLLAAAEAARGHAYVPYSHFHVGAAILADDGRVYAGCNVENASFPLGNCAEASAIAAMVGGAARRIMRMYVTGPGVDPVMPCGGCRQRIREFAAPGAVVVCHGVDGRPLEMTVEQLLPRAFGPEFTGIAE